jgi:hypothetical protein
MPFVKESEDFEISQAVLDQVKEALAPWFPDAVQVRQSHFRMELMSQGVLYGLMYVTDVRQVFDSSVGVEENLDTFYDFQGDVVAEDANIRGIVGHVVLAVPDDLRDNQDLQAFAASLELDLRYSLKFVTDYNALLYGVISPFPERERPETAPVVWVGREARFEGDEPMPSLEVTGEFRTGDFSALCDQVTHRPDGAQLREVAAQLVRRILGPSYALVWDDEGPGFCRDNSGHVLPWMILSAGELRILTFCLFLAVQYEEQHPKACLSIPAALNGLDAARYFRVMSCLRDYVLATGSSLLVQTDVSANQGTAKFLLGPAGWRAK